MQSTANITSHRQSISMALGRSKHPISLPLLQDRIRMTHTSGPDPFRRAARLNLRLDFGTPYGRAEQGKVPLPEAPALSGTLPLQMRVSAFIFSNHPLMFRSVPHPNIALSTKAKSNKPVARQIRFDRLRHFHSTSVLCSLHKIHTR